MLEYFEQIKTIVSRLEIILPTQLQHVVSTWPASQPRGMPRETLVRVFNVLDPTDTGWVAGVELQYLEAS